MLLYAIIPLLYTCVINLYCMTFLFYQCIKLYYYKMCTFHLTLHTESLQMCFVVFIKCIYQALEVGVGVGGLTALIINE